MNHQLPLNIGLREELSLANFVVGKNQQAFHDLSENNFDSGKIVVLWGEEGVGKTHLLNATCKAAFDRQQKTFYIPLSMQNELSVNVLDELENFEAIFIDDIHVAIGSRHWEEALFHLYNRVKDVGSVLILSSCLPLLKLPFVLSDLKSRLLASVNFYIHPLEDNEKVTVLCSRAKNRGLDLPTEVAAYLINRHQRNMSTLMKLLDRIDQASLIYQRRLTIPFVRSLSILD